MNLLNVKIKLETLMPMLLVCVVLSWISTPNLATDVSVSEANFQIHKILFKCFVLIICAFAFFRIQGTLQGYINHNKIFALLVIYASFISVRSPELLFSYTRLIDFVTLSFAAFFLAYCTNANNKQCLKLKIMEILSFYVLVALLVYFIVPSWGAIGAGYDGISQTYKIRLGGGFTRVDAMASISSICFLFWFFKSEKTLLQMFLMISSFLVLILTHSRSVLIAMILGIVFVYSRKNFLKLCFVAFVFVALDITTGGIFLGFLTRNESYENLITASGRIYTLIAFFEANSVFDVLVGNGFSMHSPSGRYIFVPEMNQYMSSAHNGYVSILLGSGVIGFILILIIHVLYYIRALKSNDKFHMAAFITLSISTLFDYGIWGTASQGFLIFMYINNLQSMKKV